MVSMVDIPILAGSLLLLCIVALRIDRKRGDHRFSRLVILASVTFPMAWEFGQWGLSSEHDPEQETKVILHDRDYIPLQAPVPGLLIRAMLFDLEGSIAPIAVTTQEAEFGSPFRLDSEGLPGPEWEFEGRLYPASDAPSVQYRFQRFQGVSEVHRSVPAGTPVRYSELIDGSYAALLMSEDIDRPHGLGLLDRLGRPGYRLIIVAEPIAAGDQVVELPMSHWWETHQVQILDLMTPIALPDSDGIRWENASPFPLFTVLSNISPLAFLFFGVPLVLSRSLSRSRVLILALCLLSLGLLSLGMDRLRVSLALADIASEDPRRLERGLLEIASTPYYKTTAYRAALGVWRDSPNAEARQKALAAVAINDLESGVEGIPESVLTSVSRSEPLMTATRAAFMKWR